MLKDIFDHWKNDRAISSEYGYVILVHGQKLRRKTTLNGYQLRMSRIEIQLNYPIMQQQIW